MARDASDASPAMVMEIVKLKTPRDNSEGGFIFSFISTKAVFEVLPFLITLYRFVWQ